MQITVTIDFFGEDIAFPCELTDEQLAALVEDGAITDSADEPNVYWFDESRIGEDWERDDFGAAELVKLADALLGLPRHGGALTDAEALDLIAFCLSAPEWSSSFLEDISDIVGRTTHSRVKGTYWNKH